MPKKLNFIDLCAGCGGLSLGLAKAGWQGLFAVEKDKDAFATLEHNLLMASNRFIWPEWLPQLPHSLEELTSKYSHQLRQLNGHVDLLAGGPPCQGFSTFGRRKAHDPRNQVFRDYLKVVELIDPKMVMMENVRGITCAFKGDDAPRAPDGKPLVYAEVLKDALKNKYEVWSEIIQAKDFGVPQSRPRFILIGLRLPPKGEVLETLDPFSILHRSKTAFLEEKKLGASPVTVGEAISDLRIATRELQQCPEHPRFKQGKYGNQKCAYQRLMHGNLNGALADSHRFANHRQTTIDKFVWLQAHCDAGRKLEQEERGIHANKKHTIYILHEDLPAPTVTTLPDDLIHYSEPRILTVREMARLQSFPDDFEFKGKYTTGGDRRMKECPRYTQVGNAVPPLLGEAIGRALIEFRKRAAKQS